MVNFSAGFKNEPIAFGIDHAPRCVIEKYLGKLRYPSYSFTMVRDPRARCMSMYYMELAVLEQTSHTNETKNGESGAYWVAAFNNTESKLDYMQTQCVDFQFSFLSSNTTLGGDCNMRALTGGELRPEQIAAAKNLTDAEVAAQVGETMKQYDLILVSEEYDKSMVLLARDLGVPLADVLYLEQRRADYWQASAARTPQSLALRTIRVPSH